MNIKHFAAMLLTPGWKKFSNRHKGESCYVFGDGPSIKWFDLNLFNDLPAICCGLLPFHKDFNKLNVRYMMMVEPWLFVPKLIQPKILHEFSPMVAEYRRFINRSPGIEFFVSFSNILSLSGSNINYVFRGLPENRNGTDVLLGNFDLFSGSFHASLTIAYYLGFSKIYLVGFDAWTIQPARNLHWYELGEGQFFEATNFATEFLGILKRETDIFTISVDGESRYVKNINYKNYTGNTPIFKENNDIIDAHYLNILASYSKYNIFPVRK